MSLFSSQLPIKTMVPLCRQLSTSYNAGIPIIRALALVAEQTRDRRARTVLTEMSDEIRAGATLGQAARAQARHLPLFFIELLATGEVGGRVDVMLKDLADYYEDRLAMRRTIVGAAVYPMLQLMAAWFLGTFALGLVKRLDFGQGGQALGKYIQTYLRFQVAALVSFGVIFVICVVLARLGIFKWIAGWFTTFVWPISTVTRWFSLARFFRSMSLLISSGLNIVDCIGRSANVVGNPYIAADLRKSIPYVKEGTTLVEAFGASRYLTPTAREMLQVGEQSGELDGALRKVAEYHLAQATQAVKVAATIGNVLVLLGVAALVGYIVISFWTNFYGGMMDELGI